MKKSALFIRRSLGKGGKGFTLVELLIVIAIIGILAAIVLVALDPAEKLRQARDSGRKADIGQIASALESYYTSSNPASYPSLVATVEGGCPGALTMLVSGELKKLPMPDTSTHYCYTVNANHDKAAVYATISSKRDAAAVTNQVTGSPYTSFFCWQSSQGTASLAKTSGVCDAP